MGLTHISSPTGFIGGKRRRSNGQLEVSRTGTPNGSTCLLIPHVTRPCTLLGSYSLQTLSKLVLLQHSLSNSQLLPSMASTFVTLPNLLLFKPKAPSFSNQRLLSGKLIKIPFVNCLSEISLLFLWWIVTVLLSFIPVCLSGFFFFLNRLEKKLS